MDVSVVVPVYNGGDKIRKCIKALERQKTQRRFEIILIDDGSTDESLRGLESNGIRVFRQTNAGPAAARNLGVEQSTGDIILFTDADCEPTEDWLEQMVRSLKKPRISGVKGSYLTRQPGVIPRFVQLEYEMKYERMKKDRYIDFIDTYSAGFVRDDFLRTGRFDERFSKPSVEDQEFSFRMWEKGYHMVFNPDARVYHLHSDSLWDYVKKKFRIGFWKALVLKKHPRKVFRDSHTPQSLKVEMILAVLAPALFIFSLFNERLLLPAAMAGICFLALLVPTVVKLFQKDFTVALVSPLLFFARAVSLALGLLAGGLKFYFWNASGGRKNRM